MTLLHIIDALCDVTTKQAVLLRELVTDLEHKVKTGASDISDVPF